MQWAKLVEIGYRNKKNSQYNKIKSKNERSRKCADAQKTCQSRKQFNHVKSIDVNSILYLVSILAFVKNIVKKITNVDNTETMNEATFK